MLQNLAKYLKTRFYANYDESCKNYYNYRENCEYSVSSKLKAISAILSYDNNDYEVYKMYKILKNPSKISVKKQKNTEIKPDPKIFYNKLDEAIFLAKLIKNKNIS
jgi:Tfp pilus assembly protein PilP